MKLFDILYIILLPAGLLPIYLMRRSGKKLPSTRGDNKDRNPVNRHLRVFDEYVRTRLGKKGIFITEAYSGTAHVLMPVGVLPFLKLSSFAREINPDIVQSGVIAVLLDILACEVYYSLIAWAR